MIPFRTPTVLAALAVTLVAHAAVPAAAQPRAPAKYRISDVELWRNGIAHGAMAAFPNRCYRDVSISENFVDSFRSRGFSLQALCLAITSPWIQYHVETRKPLMSTMDFLLEVPECFKNGTPFRDCRFTFDIFGMRLTDKDQQRFRTLAGTVDDAVQRDLLNGRYKTQCRCEDMQWDASLKMVKFASLAYCRVDVAPPCLEQMSRGAYRAGSLVEEVTGEKFDAVPREGAIYYGAFDISPRLPRGYAYRLHAPEGDDDSPYPDFPAGQRIRIGVQ
jgi:hypothetical protein